MSYCAVMVKKIVVVAMLALLLALNAHAYATDAPLWLHVLGWYVGVAVWFSLYVPMEVHHMPATPAVRVLVGLVWPIYMAIWLVSRWL